VIEAEIDGERETAVRIAREWGLTLHRLPAITDASAADRLVEVLS
jgi:hypothetical protein